MVERGGGRGGGEGEGEGGREGGEVEVAIGPSCLTWPVSLHSYIKENLSKSKLSQVTVRLGLLDDLT